MEDFMSNKHLGRLFAQALNEKRLALFDEFIHPEYKNHNAYVQPGPAGVKAFFRHYSASIQMRSIDIWRVKDGKFVEHWDELNLLEVFQKLGAATVRKPEEQ